jgi:hypothetical protein
VTQIDEWVKRPKDSNADAWHLFLSEYLDARANIPNGLTFMAVQIAEAIDEAAAVDGDAQWNAACDAIAESFIDERLQSMARAHKRGLK